MKLNPSKIICVGLNYKDHAAELKMDLPKNPIIFLKPPTTIIYDGDSIVYPIGQANELHYEAELAIVIKDKIKNVSELDAQKYILGYCCANDVTARDIQKADGQWTRAKSFDTFCPIGPKIVSGIDPNNLAIKLYLNDELKQSSNTSQMIFKPAYLVSFISNIMTLLPEDVIITGTPPGVGSIKKGDKIVVEIEGIGRLQNRVV
ncbi:MAG: 5-oxopent-3-ene-1 2 5-tricarboxylate decarboxylase [Candidatus Saganbacteria bacterium]|uniref:5-oxopent-3-ene-1 2 5-tricarboxylate decarboxylase n=1 Tax=Candidatus Saganbacteria bacterium TaxID=2575572 RepID=A0A833NRL5_UNCSA|nr:MAG: 5-oxopent-3-ene-1 2 5-tricarboxylate decarboxylase [Candidatus Saganbacteria bacterium]